MYPYLWCNVCWLACEESDERPPPAADFHAGPQPALDDGSEDDVVSDDIVSDSSDVDVLGGL